MPLYVLFGIDHNDQPICAKIFGNSDMQDNRPESITAEEFINSLLYKKTNLPYVIQSGFDEKLSVMQGMVCGTGSDDFIFLITLKNSKMIVIDSDFVHLLLILQDFRKNGPMKWYHLLKLC